MPDSVGTAVAFALLIVPGFMAVSGFSASRARSSPERDLYAVAQAVVVSLVLLLIAYPFQARYLGNFAKDWGVVPFNDHKIASHREAVALTGVAGLIVVPFFLGVIWGGLLNWSRDVLGDKLDKPEAWEAAWAWARRPRKSAPGRRSVGVTVLLKDNSVIQGVSARDVDVSYAPDTTRDLFLRDVRAHTAENGDRVHSSKGAYIAGPQIAAIFFWMDPPPPASPSGDEDQSATSEGA